MIGILTLKKYFNLLGIVAIFIFLSSCGGMTPTTYTITSTAEEGGSINPEGSIPISKGENQTFIIIPDEGYHIEEVLVDGISQGKITSYRFPSIQMDHTIYATFIRGASEFKVYNINTGDGYETIQAAIDTAFEGHTIVVYTGTYNENILFNNRNITVRSKNPSDPSIVSKTIIDGGGRDSVLQFVDGNTSTLQGFTIQDGDAEYGGGIDVKNSNPTITGNKIIDNLADYGGGIHVAYGSPAITNNTVNFNHAKYGGGIRLHYSASAITGNTISGNDAAYYGGGILLWGSSSPVVSENTIDDSYAKYGGGIFVHIMSSIMPSDPRPNGWGTIREKIPTGDPLEPPESVLYTVVGNEFGGNRQGSPLDYTEGAHVYFQ